MKNQTVVEVAVPVGLLPSLGQVDEIPDRLRTLLRIEFRFKHTETGVEYGNGSFHVFFVVDFFCHESSWILIRLILFQSLPSYKKDPAIARMSLNWLLSDFNL